MSWLGRIGIGWGVLGVVGILAEAIYRLAHHTGEALAGQLSLGQVAFGVGWSGLMLFFEGYRGFQRGFSPRVVARAHYLGGHPRVLHVVLAPAFCIGLFHASPRRVRAEWMLLLMVVGLVMVVRQLGQPMRGLIDLGVVLALCWGLGVVVVHSLRAVVTGRVPAVPLDLPVQSEPQASVVLARD